MIIKILAVIVIFYMIRHLLKSISAIEKMSSRNMEIEQYNCTMRKGHIPKKTTGIIYHDDPPY